MRITTIVGARPHFIKMAPVSAALAGICQETIIHTGQHYDDGLSDVFFREMGIARPAFNLAAGSGSHSAQTARIMEGVDGILKELRPDGVLLYGDTNSTLAGALAAAKNQIPIAHIEAGPRSGTLRNPEEVNRIVADHLSDLLFVPTKDAMAQIRREGLEPRSFLVGDVMLDAFLRYRNSRAPDQILADVAVHATSYWLATLHRQENTDNGARLARILEAMDSSGETIILPVHPRTRAAIARNPETAGRSWNNIHLVPPIGYPAMASLLGGASGVITDSGGVQKEAYWARKPCVTMLPFTPWKETLAEGWNVLVDADPERITRAIASAGPGGDGDLAFGRPGASAEIARIIGTAWGGGA